MADTILTRSPAKESTSTVLQHPAFGQPAVKNLKAPGPKKGTVNLQIARRKRRRLAKQSPASQDPNPVVLPPPKPGNYCYPKSMLTQAYFCLGGTGVWSAPSMSLDMLVNEKFVSPMGALLNQLESEGHDVAGARAEWLAFRELAKGLGDDAEALVKLALRLTLKRPIAAAMLINDPTK